MKRLALIVLSLLMVCAVFSSCSGGNDKPDAAEVSNLLQNGSTTAASGNSGTGEMRTVVNTIEYTLYQNIFFNNQKADYAGTETEKEGTFATLYDAYNDVTRYYVWGYNDNTHCCDWQWELKIDDTGSLPANGSFVKVTGTYEENEDALDKFWIVSPKITVETEYEGEQYDINMLTMSNTLERVQSANINVHSDKFEGQSIGLYARINNEASVMDPYYDNSWTLHISGDYSVPAFGTLVIVTGTVKDGVVSNASISDNTQY